MNIKIPLPCCLSVEIIRPLSTFQGSEGRMRPDISAGKKRERDLCLQEIQVNSDFEAPPWDKKNKQSNPNKQ